ncbi:MULTISPECIES: ATP-grasp domain-containing protein [Streptomycetaceae]|uniref:ATP-grasp domain-containing protein n=1 Tax=Streptantibioticus cattleyicolor (strain ATCC 35852 / DSM 46488 / JCM 4925 / NBRC 14057 / NRRL 8057) TaxID=1003195 RepID=F8K0K2_STREN|nr:MULTISPECIES: ATP-grasp domain-containing protein [Streptomycetaceae]AEW97407.1 hypothetical protein SCATT_50360 [Streptantibioticus cattleyicolor NRRL 8057 = DSM 46488]MYS61851.1 ATP-grasp domain-containing protein [Streptomyces sp. SID5468]CCB77730.1 conserved protein of unknown function [Streptantibioticus cattleyicolor NRRL 8057 = DSM 46488]
MDDDPGFLALTRHRTTTGQLLADAARRRGMAVRTLPGGRVPPELRGRRDAHYFGGPRYGAAVAGDLGVALLAPPDAWLTTLPYEFTGRRITAATLAEARALTRPAFVKPPSDKSFTAAVYPDGGAVPHTARLAPGTPVQIAEPVHFAAEFRLFVLDGAVRTGSQYARHGVPRAAPLDGHPHREAVHAFARRLLDACGGTLPSAVVVDVGLMRRPDGGEPRWAVVEANMAWFSNAYAADPERVLDVVLRAAGPRHRVEPRDLAFTGGTG